MNMSEFMERMLAAFPDAVVESDHEGQLVIYTGLTSVKDDNKSMYEWEVVKLPDE